MNRRFRTPARVPSRAGRDRRSIADRLTLLRLASVPILWGIALLRQPVLLGAGIALAALTDVLDGRIARSRHETSALGSRLDSIADHLLSASVLLWLAWLRPTFVREMLPWLMGWGVLAAAALLAGWFRFRRFGDLHLYSAKAAMVLGYLFVIHLFMTARYSDVVFYLWLAIASIAALEHLLMVLTRSEVDEHAGSILRRGEWR